MTYQVSVWEDVKTTDLAELRRVDSELPRRVAEVLVELMKNPWRGDTLRSRVRLEELEGCRKILFDVHTWVGKPRFRMVYRNNPDDGVIEVIEVIAVGARENLEAYRKAASRLRGRPEAR